MRRAASALTSLVLAAAGIAVTAGPARATGTHDDSGSTVGRPTYEHPSSTTGQPTSLSGVSSAYRATGFIGAGGTYELKTVATFAPEVCLYKDQFDPQHPLTDVQFCEGTGSGTTVDFGVNSLAGATDYVLVVSAANAGETGSFTTTFTQPGDTAYFHAPSSPTLVDVTRTGGQLNVSWADHPDPVVPTTDFDVQLIDPSPITSAPSTQTDGHTTSATLGLPDGSDANTSYGLTVTPVNPAGPGLPLRLDRPQALPSAAVETGPALTAIGSWGQGTDLPHRTVRLILGRHGSADERELTSATVPVEQGSVQVPGTAPGVTYTGWLLINDALGTFLQPLGDITLPAITPTVDVTIPAGAPTRASVSNPSLVTSPQPYVGIGLTITTPGTYTLLATATGDDDDTIADLYGSTVIETEPLTGLEAYGDDIDGDRGTQVLTATLAAGPHELVLSHFGSTPVTSPIHVYAAGPGPVTFGVPGTSSTPTITSWTSASAGQATVTVSAPGLPQGTLTGYTLTASSTGQLTLTYALPVGGGPFVVSPLPGGTWTASVVALTAAGSSLPATASTVVQPLLPVVPTSLGSVPGKHSITAVFRTAAVPGTAWRLDAIPVKGGKAGSVTGPGKRLTVTGLTDGKAYRLVLTVTDAHGASVTHTFPTAYAGQPALTIKRGAVSHGKVTLTVTWKVGGTTLKPPTVQLLGRHGSGRLATVSAKRKTLKASVTFTVPVRSTTTYVARTVVVTTTVSSGGAQVKAA